MKEFENRIMLYGDLKKKLSRHVMHKHDIRYNEYKLLKALYFCDGQTLEAIAEYADLGKLQVEQILDSLKQKKLVTIRTDRIYLEDHAKKKYKEINSEIEKQEDKFIDELGSTQYKEILSSFDTLISSLSDFISK